MCAGKKVLAVQEHFGSVTECSCGTVHVTVGPVSLALDAQSLQKLHKLVGNAIRKSNSEEISESESLFFHSSHLELRRVLKLKH